MSRSTRLEKKLHSLHLMAAAEAAVLDERLAAKLWALEPGDSIEFSSACCDCAAVQKYRLEYVITRGPVPGHWLYKAFDPKELTLLFTAKGFRSICHGWTLFDE
ncbi:hypothetical protein [Pseudomonas sp. UFMG81]|jgi:hypothetical protein|uniref:hypothetical protein n=1 Tax=Pseudomonas sp. UFMG81 TaxID=2745936 RepID=UPI00188EA4AC|nr:hypothetical protein [Pseudomonas sp. UFMG81]